MSKTISASRILRACEEDDNIGFCTECESCGARAVYGAEELLLMGVG